jgi:hypothetical protein
MVTLPAALANVATRAAAPETVIHANDGQPGPGQAEANSGKELLCAARDGYSLR